MFNHTKSHEVLTKQGLVTPVKTQSSFSSLESPNISSEQLRELAILANLSANNQTDIDISRDLILPDPPSDQIGNDICEDLPSPKSVSLETLRFLVKEISGQIKPRAPEKFKIWQITEGQTDLTIEKPRPKSPSCNSENVIRLVDKTKPYYNFGKSEPRKRSFGVQKSYSLDLEKSITPENDLRNYKIWDYRNKISNSSNIYEHFDDSTSEKLDSHMKLEEKLKELTEGNNLEKWLDSLNLPQRKSIDTKVVRNQIHEYFKFKSQSEEEEEDDSLLKKFWSKVKGNKTKGKGRGRGISKQTFLIIGGLVAYVSVTAVTAELLPLVWPAVLGIGTAGEEAIVDIGVEFFQQIPDPAYNLLHSHAQNAKPLTYAWTNQYILWKYMK